jgi:hypothetical protein
MTIEYRDRKPYGTLDIVLYAVGVAGLTMCLTLIWLGMRAVMDIGGFCAEGGPYVINTPCPEGVPLLLTGGIFGLFGFGGLMTWKGAALGGPFAGLVALAWPALFLSLGWNFLEYAVNPPAGEGVVLGWLIPGVVFVLMGAGPLLLALPIAQTGRAATARERVAGRVAPRPRPSPVLDAERAEVATLLTELRNRKSAAASDAQPDAGPPVDLVTMLERLAALREKGSLSYSEFEQAKKALLKDAGAT